MNRKFCDEEKEELINYVETRDNFFRDEDNYLASVWEEHLTSEYWKSWREKIRNFQNEDEFVFFVDRLLKLRTNILWTIRYYKGDRYDADYIRKLVDINEKKLQNISEEDFKKKGKSADVGFKELSAQEMLNDPWFSKEIDNIFGLENGKLPKVEKDSNGDINYQTWTKEQLISEINRLKTENEQLKNNQTLTTSERQERLQQNQQKLEQIASYVSIDSKPTNSNNNFPTSLVVGGGVLATAGLIGLLIVRKKKKR